MICRRMRSVAIGVDLVVVLAGIGLLVACDRSSPSSAPSNPTPDDTAVARHVQIESLAQALANRITHLCVDGRNNLYWTQENDVSATGAGEAGRDVLFMLPDAAAPAAGVGAVASELPRA